MANVGIDQLVSNLVVLCQDHQGVLALIGIRITVVLAIGILDVVFQVGQFLKLLFDILFLAHEKLKWKLSVTYVDRNAELEVIFISFEAIMEVLGYDTLSS